MTNKRAIGWCGATGGPEGPGDPPDDEPSQLLTRWGIQWNGPREPIATPMADGYWTAWHLANAEIERLTAALKQATCSTCNGRGVIGGIVDAQSGYQTDPCPDCGASEPETPK